MSVKMRQLVEREISGEMTYEQIAEFAGANFQGIQASEEEEDEQNNLVLFTSRETGSTFAVPEGDVTVSSVSLAKQGSNRLFKS